MRDRIVDGNSQFVDGELIGKPSATGMLVNRRTQEIHYLRDRDEIVLGSIQMVYYFESRPSLSDEEPPDPNFSMPRKSYPLHLILERKHCQIQDSAAFHSLTTQHHRKKGGSSKHIGLYKFQP